MVKSSFKSNNWVSIMHRKKIRKKNSILSSFFVALIFQFKVFIGNHSEFFILSVIINAKCAENIFLITVLGFFFNFNICAQCIPVSKRISKSEESNCSVQYSPLNLRRLLMINDIISITRNHFSPVLILHRLA